MALFALYEMWRPWNEGDTLVVAGVLVLFFLLAVFARFKSYLANGSLIGWALGCIAALASNDNVARRRMSYVEWGLLLGLASGILAKRIFAFRKKPKREKSAPAALTKSNDDGQVTLSEPRP